MSEIVFLVEEAPEGGYSARALGESIFTQAESLEELRENVRDAVRCHFDEGRVAASQLVIPAEAGIQLFDIREHST
ncbi:type II toxin-antitoxin system HicB family antitoxin [Tahibacter soli]|uniref:2-oxoisovalerate dehydrogenase n=1 Tax=Tahibacter soli TaxID=2983605 RepID=A0A9X3YQ18_9GAMM|nr:hypothetical protein [Tahibacter soli]MDC8014853.1 hypothetical protein [Tahibacter soli]